MTQTAAFVAQLTSDRRFGPGERARLRALPAGRLDEDVPAFDLFTGLWWPLRQRTQAAPRREVAWLVLKLYAACTVPHVRPSGEKGPPLAQVLGRCEPRERHLQARFRRRVDALLCTPLGGLEPHLRWALVAVCDAVIAGRAQGIDWVQLTDDLSIWDRGEEHRWHRDIRDTWAEQYWRAQE